jgi:hypothetical protein
MKTETFTQLELATNDPALKNSENPEALKRLMEEVKIAYRSLGTGKHFEDDKEERERLRVQVTRRTRTIQFEYGMSIHDTEILHPTPYSMNSNNTFKGKHYYSTLGFDYKHDVKKAQEAIRASLLSQLLSCMEAEYFCPKSFTDFCSEFGYDEDSRKADRTHRALLEQSAKLERIFSEDEIQALPR